MDELYEAWKCRVGEAKMVTFKSFVSAFRKDDRIFLFLMLKM